MRKLLWVGDAGCASGFAKATHGVCDFLDYRANPDNPTPWDVTVLGINYRGDPHSFKYPIYTALPGGDLFGVGRIVWMCDAVQPDAILIQQDPWNFPHYVARLKGVPEYKDLPVIGSVAVDGLNCRGTDLNDLTLAIFWTRFGEEQARRGGFTSTSAVVPLGVDLTIYAPGDRREARQRLKLPERCLDGFIVGNVNRNQPRKRLDLSIRYFARWWEEAGRPKNAFLYLHVAPTGEVSYDVRQLSSYYGILHQLILLEPEPWYGQTNEFMVDTYRSFDVQISTSQGEGWGLTTLEGMACGIPQIVPEWAALGEWAKTYAIPVPCTTTAATIGRYNAIGGVADEEQFVKALHALYSDPDMREEFETLSIWCANQNKYRWPEIGQGMAEAIDLVLTPEGVAV